MNNLTALFILQTRLIIHDFFNKKVVYEKVVLNKESVKKVLVLKS